MNQFLLLIRGGEEGFGQLSPEQLQEHMGKWGAWMGEIKAEGMPLEKEGKVTSGGGSVVSDGPFAEGSEVVGGYLLIPANDLDHATELSKGCPVHEFDGTVEVRAISSMPE